MLDFLAHAFARTEVINNGTKPSTPFSRKHFSLDTTVILALLLLIVIYVVWSRYQLNSRNKLLRQLRDQSIPLQPVNHQFPV